MKKKFGKGTIEVERVYSGGGQGYDSSGRYYGTGLPVYAVTYEDDERDRWSGEKGREITVQVRASSISEAIESAGDEITRRLGIPRSEWKSKSSRAREGGLRTLSPEASREGLYGYRGASVEISGPAGGRWHATVRFRNQVKDLEARSASDVARAAMDWIDRAPELRGRSLRENVRHRAGGASHPRRHSRVREGGPISPRQVLDFLGPYMEHESLDAPKESARIARILNGAHGSRGVTNALEEVDKIIGGHGIEAIRGESYRGGYYGDIVGLYVNMGDTYNATVVYDTETGEFELTTWGDWVEQHQDEYEII